ncbi:class I adenylate-forming enzyme family protein [Allopusillimonas ginsengisoli]|uniref:class I adenylate-forming enzyme family protein n=1 Tax=Allopusillimonas ginsengisoli TaxID=453575 RepID=UPI0010C1E72B|nr:long-chain fatty acid--CoA ligase [Allopusillimonas ginsengisoli]
MNIAQWLQARALLTPDAPALFSGSELKADYRQFAAQACGLAESLRRDHGIQEGDRIALYMPNRIELLVLMYAVWWAGAVVVPINYKLHAKEAAWIAENAQASLLFSDQGQSLQEVGLPEGCRELGVDTPAVRSMLECKKMLSAPAPRAPHTLAWLFYTSGTTGRPKGVMLTHDNLVAMSLCYTVDVDDVSTDDAVLYAAPMSHGAGLYNFVFVRLGARHVVPESRGFDSAEILDLGKHLGGLSMFAAPTMVKRLISVAKAAGSAGEGLKSIVCGGAPMYAADFVEALDVFGPKFMQIYGQGESPMTITAMRREIIADRTHPQWHERLASVGTPQACIEVRIVDDTLCDVPTGTHGEVLVRGITVMQGYWRNSEATQDTLVDGWLRTGDIGFLDEAGFLTLTDRSKDVIISGGSNIYPREVEEVLLRHPHVFEAAVVGSPHADWGEEVVAFVVASSGAQLDAAELEAWCKAEIASFKKPKRYLFCPELPKNSYGKVLKTALREKAKEPV